jgi:hypothetical protein
MLQHAKAKTQISRICSGMAMIGTGPACTPNGGYVRGRSSAVSYIP